MNTLLGSISSAGAVLEAEMLSRLCRRSSTITNGGGSMGPRHASTCSTRSPGRARITELEHPQLVLDHPPNPCPYVSNALQDSSPLDALQV